MRHGGNLMERKAQVRKIASGEMNPVQIEFYAEKAKRFVMIRGKRMDCLRRKRAEAFRKPAADPKGRKKAPAVWS